MGAQTRAGEEEKSTPRAAAGIERGEYNQCRVMMVLAAGDFLGGQTLVKLRGSLPTDLQDCILLLAQS